MKKSSLFACLLAIAGLLSLLTTSGAARLVVFGDSLSDNGNTFAAVGLPQPPYYQGRWTNGPNWVDYFTGLALLPPTTAYLQDRGTNFAVGGSSSPFLAAQIGIYLATNGGRANLDDLFVIWIGANDFRAGVDWSTTVDSIQTGLALLGAAGAQSVILLDVPDISLTPEVISTGGSNVQAAKQFVATVNGNLQSRVPLEALLLGVRLTYVDVNAIFAQIIQRPAAFGFSNSTGAAFNSSTGIVQPNPNSYVFWDGFHPTTPAHQIAAQTVWARVNAPSTFLRLHGVLKRGSSRFGLDRIRLSSYHSLRGSLPGRF